MVFSYENIPTSKTILSAAASLTATALLLRTLVNDILPTEIQQHLFSSIKNISTKFSSQFTLIIEDFDGLTSNHMFEAANLYLGTKLSPSTKRIKITKPLKDDHLILSLDRNQPVSDSFQGITNLKWVLYSTPSKRSSDQKSNIKTELRYFELTFHKKHKDVVLKTYLPYILSKAKEIKEEIKSVRLHTVDYNGTDYWSSVVLNHPARFDTMAMYPEVKSELIEDLDRFVNRREYYKRVGKAWKRGYLFYGPPGTGKSSLVAAMANYLRFDVYDLDLREVQCNSDLRRLLIGTANRSILVIEDIDCSIGFQNRESEGESAQDDKITLSGLLNFIDGLWSSCGDERIIVFTTNNKERLDPALLRPGRMDVQLEMSYCSFSGFKILASNYLKLDEHQLFGVIEELLGKVKATPAEVAGELMKSDDAEIALQCLIKSLMSKDKHKD